MEFPRHFHFLKKEKNDGISNTFLKSQVNFQAYFEFQMEFLRLYFYKNWCRPQGVYRKFLDISGWNGPMFYIFCVCDETADFNAFFDMKKELVCFLKTWKSVCKSIYIPHTQQYTYNQNQKHTVTV